MLKKITKEIKDYFNNKKVLFNTNDIVNSKTKSFKLGLEDIDNKKYIIYIRLNEEEDYVKVINFEIIPIIK